MSNEASGDVTAQLEQVRREAAYYRKLARECGERRLKETEDLSNLIVRLRWAERELELSRDELEQRVQERTTALQDANARLTHEMQERQKIEEELRATHEKLKRSYTTLEHDQHRLEEIVQARDQELISIQQERVRELSIPLLPILDNVVLIPLIGSIDAPRARQVLDTLLEEVSPHRATVAILDITRVQPMNAHVAQVLAQTAQAVQVAGTQVVLTGIQPEMMQTLVHLGTDLDGLVIHTTLPAGMAYVLQNIVRYSV